MNIFTTRICLFLAKFSTCYYHSYYLFGIVGCLFSPLILLSWLLIDHHSFSSLTITDCTFWYVSSCHWNQPSDSFCQRNIQWASCARHFANANPSFALSLLSSFICPSLIHSSTSNLGPTSFRSQLFLLFRLLLLLLLLLLSRRLLEPNPLDCLHRLDCLWICCFFSVFLF